MKYLKKLFLWVAYKLCILCTTQNYFLCTLPWPFFKLKGGGGVLNSWYLSSYPSSTELAMPKCINDWKALNVRFNVHILYLPAHQLCPCLTMCFNPKQRPFRKCPSSFCMDYWDPKRIGEASEKQYRWKTRER